MIEPTDIDLVETCGACPEQYDAYFRGMVVGYLRLRHGFFYVECPCPGGETVLEGHPEGDGCFDMDERDGWLDKAKAAIAEWVEKEIE